AHGESTLRSVRRSRWADLSFVRLHIARVGQLAVFTDWKNSNRPTEVIRHKDESTRRANADEGWTGPAGTDRVEQLERTVIRVDGNRAAGCSVALADAIGRVGGVRAWPGGFDGEATRARANLMAPTRRQRAIGSIHLEDMNAAAVPGREIDLRRQRVTERRT